MFRIICDKNEVFNVEEDPATGDGEVHFPWNTDHLTTAVEATGGIVGDLDGGTS